MSATNETPGNYGVKVLHSAATFYRKRYIAHPELARRERILKATAETAAKFNDDQTLARTAAVYVHKGTLHGEWRVG